MDRICQKHNEQQVLSGKYWKCKTCNKEHQRKWFEKNKEVQAERVRNNNHKYIERNARYVFNYLLNHPCIDCGETDPIVLQFDHLDPTTKTTTISICVRRANSLQTLIEEMAKCEVVCANCHMQRTAKQFGWRKLLWQS